MKSFMILVGAGLLCVSAYAADQKPAPAAAGKSPNLHELMKNVIAPQAQVIWDLGNNAQDDQGNLDPKKLKPADWAKFTSAATKTKQAAQTLATADHVMAAAPGQKIDGEGNPNAFGAKEVQKTIDAQPKAFAAFAQQLVVSMDKVLDGAAKHDAAKLAEVSGELDQLCESCHTQFWYPQQKAPK